MLSRLLSALARAMPLVFAVVALGCGGSGDDEPVPTLEREPTPTAEATSEREPLVTAEPTTSSPAPTATPPPAGPTTRPPTPPPVGPTDPSAGRSLFIVASDTRFDTARLDVRVGELVTLTLDNQDEGITHNIAIFGSGSGVVARTEVVPGPSQSIVTFMAPARGSYPFLCEVHPRSMTGALVVE